MGANRAIGAVAGVGAVAVTLRMTLRVLGESVQATAAERSRALPGDEVIPDPLVVLDSATTLPAAPETVWPWLVQLGKRRAGWYLPAWAERASIPPGRRALWYVDPALQQLRPGDTIPDWGPGSPEFEVVVVDAPHALVYSSQRGRRGGDPTALSWALHLEDAGTATSRLQLRLRFGNKLRHPRVAAVLGSRVDQLTVALLFAGLSERVAH